MSELQVLTAPRGAGKTAFCRIVAEQARVAGWEVAGILSPPVFENGVKTGILAQDLRTGETRPLAHLSTSNPQTSTFNLPFGDWLFDPSVFNWGNSILEASLPCDLFIVDELGPLELLRGEGWVNALKVLRQPGYQIGIVVIRPELLETVRQDFPIAQVITFNPLSDIVQPVLDVRVAATNDRG